MSLLFEKSGILTTVQDFGRNGYRRFGINPNGAMDRTAVRLINILLGNTETEAVLEMHFSAPEILFEKPTIFALGGADFAPKLNGKAIENWRIFKAEKESVLKFDEKVFGNRAYLSIKGGLKIKEVLKSKSTNLTAKFGGFEGRKLQNRDRIEFNSEFQIPDSKFQNKISFNIIPSYSRFPTIRVAAGAEFENLTAFSEQNFLRTDFVISPDSNRMGFRLTGAPLYLPDKIELVSSAVNFGTIQLLPDGQMIILMADHQTSGGYPRLASVIPTDLPLLAQLGANDKIAFHLVSLRKAVQIAFEFERNVHFLKTAVRFLL